MGEDHNLQEKYNSILDQIEMSIPMEHIHHYNEFEFIITIPAIKTLLFLLRKLV